MSEQINETKIFEDLYYKECSKVALFQIEIEYLKKEIEYLKAKNTYTIRYGSVTNE